MRLGMSWFMPVIPALRRWRQESCEFKASLDDIEKPCIKIKFKKELFMEK
jgi:hypothetical protein